MIPTLRRISPSLLASALLLGSLSTPASGQWLPFGTPLTTVSGTQDQVAAIPDGAGGMIVAWHDQRLDAGDIYVQRISGTGLPLWAAGGIPLCAAPNEQRLPQIVTDGAGGAIVAWQDNRTDAQGDIYAQRVDPTGLPLWLGGGVPLVTGASENTETVSRFRMIPDGVGGAIFTFSDDRLALGGFAPGVPKVWGERVTAFGSPLWGPGGVPIAAGGGAYDDASLAPDGYGGIFVVWTDKSTIDWNIVAQHIDPSGAPLLGPGLAICPVVNQQLHPEVVADGSGGAVIAWQDNRVDAGGDIYGQRITAAGVILWTPGGNPLVTGTSANNLGEYIIRMTLDGGSSVTMAFSDDRLSGGTPDPGQSKVWAQRVTLNGGVPQWGSGVPVAAAAGSHSWFRIVSDTEGGSIVVWQDGSISTNTNIFAQRLDSGGAPQWGPGVSVCNALGQQSAPAAVADGLGGVLSAWTDERGVNADVYAQYVDFSGVPMSNARWECRSWIPDGTPVATKPLLQSDPAAAPDGVGGAIIAWRDEVADTGDIYVQRMSSSGAHLWGSVGVCVQPGLQREPRVVPDGVGGAIVLWQDNRSDPAGDLYAQHVDALGNRLWAPNGVPVVSGPSSDIQRPETFRAVPDGVGGAILTFQDTRRPDGVIDGVEHIWAQRVDGSGSLLWGAGVPVSTLTGEQVDGSTVSDGAGGIIVSWHQAGAASLDILGQRIDFSGTRRWGSAAMVCSDPMDQLLPNITSDGAGGAIVSWVDLRVDAQGDVYAQKLNPLGGALWAANGVPQITGPSRNIFPLLGGVTPVETHIRSIPDNRGGAFLAVLDSRDAGGVVGSTPKIWAQHVKPSGSPEWGNGVPVGVGDSNFNQSIVTDGEGGSVVVWQQLTGADWNIRAQRLAPGAGAYWIAGGIPVSTAASAQTLPAVTVDGRGHAIAAWADARSDLGDIYGQRICVANRMTTDVTEEPQSPKVALLSAPSPNPAGDMISYALTVTKPGRTRVFLADVRGRVVAMLLDRQLEPGQYHYVWSNRDGEKLAAGVYFLSVTSANLTASQKLVIVR